MIFIYMYICCSILGLQKIGRTANIPSFSKCSGRDFPTFLELGARGLLNLGKYHLSHQN